MNWTEALRAWRETGGLVWHDMEDEEFLREYYAAYDPGCQCEFCDRYTQLLKREDSEPEPVTDERTERLEWFRAKMR